MHFITRKQLPRRTFLRGAGATVALPFLDAMVPAGGASAAPRSARRAAHGSSASRRCTARPAATTWGATKHLFAPETTGRDFTLVPDNPLSALEPYRDYMTIVSNTDVRMAEAFSPPEIGGDHFRSSAVFLTQSHPKQTQGSDLWAGTSLDQMYAKRFGQATPMPSMQFCIENLDQAGGCTYNYSCAYTDSISWASPNEPLPMIRDPRVAFDMLFGAGGDAGRSRRAARDAQQHPRLDRRRGDARARAARRRRPRAARPLPRQRARDRAPHPGGRSAQPQRRAARAAGCAGRRARFVLRAHAADVRPPGARAADRHDARDHVQDRAATRRTASFPESGSNQPFHPASHHGNKEDGDPRVQQDLQVPRRASSRTSSRR